jgi:hypothetical protein
VTISMAMSANSETIKDCVGFALNPILSLGDRKYIIREAEFFSKYDFLNDRRYS